VVVDYTVRHEKEHDWVGNRMKERAMARALHRVLPAHFDRFDELFELVKARNEYR
jgi:type I restriction enzyme R subunit